MYSTNIWTPFEGLAKQKRDGPNTEFAKKRADHRNRILKDWAITIEPDIETKIPDNYVCPFDINKCVYCLSPNIGKSGDEFRPITQRGRMNRVNCLPCCGKCNPSKQDKCGTKLIEWITDPSPKTRAPIDIEQQEKLINWYRENEKYLIIPLDIRYNRDNKTYQEKIDNLDNDLNKFYEWFA